MTGWQSIETGPKDGTKVLLFIPTFKETPIQIGQYRKTEHRDHGVVTYVDEGWRIVAALCLEHINATMWRPLPDPPTSVAD